MSDTPTPRPYSIGVFWFVTLLAAGCLSLGKSGGLSWTLADSPALAPYAASVDAPGDRSLHSSSAKPDPGDPSHPKSPRGVTDNGVRRRALSAPEPIATSPPHDPIQPSAVPASPAAAPDVESPSLHRDVASPTLDADRLVDVHVAGPDQRTVGSRAEFIVTLANSAGRVLPDTRVAIDYPAALKLREVSAGATREPGRLVWDLGDLLAEERVQIQAEFECASIADDASVRVAAGGREYQTRTQIVPLRIAPVTCLDLQIGDSADPIALGESTEFVIQVQNVDSVVHRQLTLHLMPTDQLRLGAIQARAGQRTLPVRIHSTGEGQTVTVQQDLPPGETWTVFVPAVARAVGVGQIVALLDSDQAPTPLKARETTLVDPPLAPAQ